MTTLLTFQQRELKMRLESSIQMLRHSTIIYNFI